MLITECKSKSGCWKCGRRHQTSLCSKNEHLMTAKNAGNTAVIYPVVVVEVEGVMCQALLDTGAGSLYASAVLLDQLPKQGKRKGTRQIEMML